MARRAIADDAIADHPMRAVQYHARVQWETLREAPCFRLRRSGRFLVMDLAEPHVVISTSARTGGQQTGVRHLVNHQSCEGTAHHARHEKIHALGADAYHDAVCAEIGLAPDVTATMGTAASMRYVAVVTRADEDVSVTAAVTAGVEGNATTAGDPASWRETSRGVEKLLQSGTINTMLVVNQPLAPGALARAIVTMTEGKSAALQRLAVPSRQSVELATGTGTDQFAIAAPASGDRVLTLVSSHTKLGEMIGAAARDATIEALRWQNGLEMSYTRSVFHALGRYGVKEATVLDEIAPFLPPADLELLQKNSKALFYDPLVGAAAYALAAVLDRVRHGSLPSSVQAEAIAQHAAVLAANAAAAPDRWPEFRAELHAHAAAGDARTVALAALAFGWAEKWRAR